MRPQQPPSRAEQTHATSSHAAHRPSPPQPTATWPTVAHTSPNATAPPRGTRTSWRPPHHTSIPAQPTRRSLHAQTSDLEPVRGPAPDLGGQAQRPTATVPCPPHRRARPPPRASSAPHPADAAASPPQRPAHLVAAPSRHRGPPRHLARPSQRASSPPRPTERPRRRRPPYGLCPAASSGGGEGKGGEGGRRWRRLGFHPSRPREQRGCGLRTSPHRIVLLKTSKSQLGYKKQTRTTATNQIL